MQYTIPLYLSLTNKIGKAVLKHRIINGDRYIPKSGYKKKVDAEKVAKVGRSFGKGVRIIHYNSYYFIFKRV